MELTEGVKDFILTVTDLVVARVRELLAPPAAPTRYSYVGGLTSDAAAYSGGVAGTAVWNAALHGARIQIVDLIACGGRAGDLERFVVDDVTASGESLLGNAGPICAAMFAPNVIGRGFRTKTVVADTKQPITVHFRNVGDPHDDPRPIFIAARIDSDEPPSTDLPKGDLT